MGSGGSFIDQSSFYLYYTGTYSSRLGAERSRILSSCDQRSAERYERYTCTCRSVSWLRGATWSMTLVSNQGRQKTNPL